MLSKTRGLRYFNTLLNEESLEAGIAFLYLSSPLLLTNLRTYSLLHNQVYEKIDTGYRILGYCQIKKSFLDFILLMEIVM